MNDVLTLARTIVGSWSREKAFRLLSWAFLVGTLVVQGRLVWVHHAHFSALQQAVLYASFVLVDAFLVWLALRSRVETQVRVFTAVGATLVTLWMVEIAWYFVFFVAVPPATPHQRAVEKAGLHYESVSEVLARARAKGVTPYVHLLVGQMACDNRSLSSGGVFPLAHKPNSPTFGGNEEGTLLLWDADEQGFNNPKGLWGGKPVDVMVIGDSFAHGFHLPREQSFPGKLGARYPRTLNLGVTATGPLRELGIFREYVEPVRPKALIWAFFEGNDLDDLRIEKAIPFLIRYLDEKHTQNLMSRTAEIDRYFEERCRADTVFKPRPFWSYPRDFLDHLVALDFFKLRFIRQSFGWMIQEPPDVALLERILATVKRRVDSWNGEFYFVYLPCWERYSTGKAPARPASPVRREVLDAARRAGATVVDLDEDFRRQGDPLSLFPYRIDGHYNEKGNELVVRRLLNELQRSRVLHGKDAGSSRGGHPAESGAVRRPQPAG